MASRSGRCSDQFIQHRAECAQAKGQVTFSLQEMGGGAGKLRGQPPAVGEWHHEVGAALPDHGRDRDLQATILAAASATGTGGPAQIAGYGGRTGPPRRARWNTAFCGAATSDQLSACSRAQVAQRRTNSA